MSESFLRLAVTTGDPAGVGPELSLRLLQEPIAGVQLVLIGDVTVLSQVASRLNLPMPQRTMDAYRPLPDRSRSVAADSLLLDANLLAAKEVTPGVVSAATGAASFAYVRRAIDLALSEEVDAIVTGPINKSALAMAKIPYPGHTEILADLTHTQNYLMMLTSLEITCSLVTTHIPLREVPGALSAERIEHAIELTAEAMQRLRGRPPRLAVCGLNPHAGESGLFGDEEIAVIEPAIEAARRRGHTIRGPLPPDTAFLPSLRATVDAYICMYHDQGLIPLKTLAFDEAVNVTLGLPIVRTSVDHGTALDIAWQGKASASSFRHATRLAAELA